jgi:hypothetical protein
MFAKANFFAVVLVALTASTPQLLAGCAHQDWNVWVSSDASTDVIVRVTDAVATRDVFLKANQESVVTSVPDARLPATIELLDTETCKVLAAGDLPATGPTVAFGDGEAPGELTIEIAARPQPFSGQLPPIDGRCLGR